MTNDMEVRVNQFLDNSNEVHSIIQKIDEQINVNDLSVKDVDKLNVVARQALRDSKDPSVESYKKVLNLSDAKFTLLDIKSNVNSIYKYFGNIKVGIDEQLAHIEMLLTQGKDLLEQNNKDIERFAKLKEEQGGIDSDDIFRDQILADRKSLLEYALISLDQQREQLNTIKPMVDVPVQNLQFLVDSYLPAVLLQINTNSLLLKYDIVNDLNDKKVVELDVDDITNKIKVATDKNNTELIDPRQYQVQTLTQQSMIIEDALLKIKNSNSENYMFKGLMDKELDKLLAQIDIVKRQS